MEISLTVNYIISTDKENFWNPENGRLSDEMKEKLDKIFPQKISLPNVETAEFGRMSYIPLREGENATKCIACNSWCYVPKEEYKAEGLRHCRIINGYSFCESCFWELESEISDGSFFLKIKNQKDN